MIQNNEDIPLGLTKTINNLTVDRFCKAIQLALEARVITGEQALDLIKGFWRTLCEREKK